MEIVTVCVFSVVEKKKKAVQRCEEQLLRMEVQATDREENKQIALSTSKLNYLDPRISVAWWGSVTHGTNLRLQILFSSIILWSVSFKFCSGIHLKIVTGISPRHLKLFTHQLNNIHLSLMFLKSQLIYDCCINPRYVCWSYRITETFSTKYSFENYRPSHLPSLFYVSG